MKTLAKAGSHKILTTTITISDTTDKPVCNARLDIASTKTDACFITILGACDRKCNDKHSNKRHGTVSMNGADCKLRESCKLKHVLNADDKIISLLENI